MIGPPDAWVQALYAQCDRPPARPRAPWRVAAHASPLGSIEPALAQRLADAGLPLQREGDGWVLDAAGDTSALDVTLERIARTLLAQRAIGGWRNELLQVTDADGHPLARIERAAVRALGIATQAVHLIGRMADGSVWVQQRAFDKAVDPGRWDTLMGGMVAAGESIATTLARETLEEAGLQLDQLQGVLQTDELVVRRPVPDGYLIERLTVFEATLPAELVPVNHDGEVAAFECLTPEALSLRLQAGAFALDAGLMLARALLRWQASARDGLSA